MEILTAILEIMLGGLVQVGEGIGGALSSLVTSLFVGASGGLTVFGTVIIVFSAISLGLSLCYLVVHWLTSLGKGGLN